MTDRPGEELVTANTRVALVTGANKGIDRVQLTLVHVTAGQTGLDAIFQAAADFDLELIEHRTLDRHVQEPVYRPTLHR